MKPRTYSAEDFFTTTDYQMPSPYGLVFGPVSGDLLVSSNEGGTFNAWRLNQVTRSLDALTHSVESAIHAVSWFPDDERTLYTSDNRGDELHHIFVRETDGSTRDLTPGKGHKSLFIGWNAARDAFYALSNERDPKFFDLWHCRTRDYGRHCLYENPGMAIEAVSRNGRYVALRESLTSRNSNIYLVDLQAREPEPFLISFHEGNAVYSIFGFSPDDETLIYGTNEFSEFVQAWSFDVKTGDRSCLVAADWDVVNLTSSKSGRLRAHGLNEDGATIVELRDIEAAWTIHGPGLPSGTMGKFHISEDEKRVAFLHSGDTTGNNIYLMNLEDHSSAQLTEAMAGDVDPHDLVAPSVIRHATYDREQIPGILYTPHGASSNTPVPAMLYVHGGPGGQCVKGYNPLIQHIVNQGYAVLAMNNRGSSGYGKRFHQLDIKAHGDADLRDVLASRTYLAEQDWIDENRIGIIGGSYGGYLVAAALAFHPEVFNLGINIFGVTNWVRTLSSIPAWWESFRNDLYDKMGDPAEDEDRLRKISPLFHAENIVRPLLVVQGENDPRVLKVESDELVEAVRGRNVPVEYVVFPDEGHGFVSTKNRIAASEAYAGFLAKYLKG